MTKLTKEEKVLLESAGVVPGQTWGGPQKVRYYAPDGEEVWGIPALREYVVKKDGKIIKQGTRDANLDRWSLSKPKVRKIHCLGCDGYHSTRREADKCLEKQQAILVEWNRKSRKEQPDDRITKLEEKLDALIKALTKEK